MAVLFISPQCKGKNISASPVTVSQTDEHETPDQTEPDKDETLPRELAATMARSLDNRQLAAQVMLCGIDGRGHLSADMITLLEECPAGGIVLFRYNLDTDNAEIKSLTSESSELITSHVTGGISPFIAVDHEGGDVSRFKPGVAVLPAAGIYWETGQSEGWEKSFSLIEEDSFRAGTEISDLGIDLNLAPVAEILNSRNDQFLGSRSYGPDAGFTAKAASAFIRGMERAGLLCVVKHFPGSAGPDPHRFPSLINETPDELALLTAPFAELITSGECKAIMVAHTMVTAKDNVSIASLSPAIMKTWLREELGFNGIIICDDFSMASARSPAAARSPVSASGAAAANASAPASPAEAAVQSLAAGADMVLVWPPDIRRTHRAIQAAIADGSLPVERLREAAQRIIFEKIRMGLVSGE